VAILREKGGGQEGNKEGSGLLEPPDQHLHYSCRNDTSADPPFPALKSSRKFEEGYCSSTQTKVTLSSTMGSNRHTWGTTVHAVQVQAGPKTDPALELLSHICSSPQ